MKYSNKYSDWFARILPSPFAIAVLLTVFTWFLTFCFGQFDDSGILSRVVQISSYWELGVWDNSLLVFAVQMMLMLVLGHTLALTPQIQKLIVSSLKYCKNSASSAAIVVFLTMVVGFFNWGLGLIFGAILARSVGEYALRNNIPLNYPLIGAAGYSGLLVWHGGFSGSSLTKIAEQGHMKNMMVGILPENEIAGLPDFIDFSQTVFSPMNIVVSLACLIVIPLVFYRVGLAVKNRPLLERNLNSEAENGLRAEDHGGAEKLDHSLWMGRLFGAILFFVLGVKIFYGKGDSLLSEFTPNNINLTLLAVALFFHGSFHSFLQALEKAIGGVSGILIQFPLYFGIMGMMRGSGLVLLFSENIVAISNSNTYPIFTFISAAVVNLFVPSGGGQWAIQGPIIIQSATELGVSLPKSIMAMAYGDQLTNMLQPFWALPLLGITGLKAKEIIPYTFILFLLGSVIFITALVIF
ncbi:MAG: short-chain fatty acid transporter [Flavobacteriales bacterium]|nr:short-chain fatty acid transporter [Flavobacteriales bacterium]